MRHALNVFAVAAIALGLAIGSRAEEVQAVDGAPTFTIAAKIMIRSPGSSGNPTCPSSVTCTSAAFCPSASATVTIDSPGRMIGRCDRLCGQIGVVTRALTDGTMTGPPAARLYAVEPVGVERIRPSAR